jgi:squalene-associated FAD-dependent desaturase
MPQIAGNADTPPRIAIVGGGLAGLAAAVRLSGRGWHVELLEARRKLGGRAGSFVDRADGTSIDHCQHVAMGCCTNFLDFCCRTGIGGLFTRHEQLTFFGPGGERSDFRPARWLPPPLHLAGALWRMRHLSLGDKLPIARAMLALVRTSPTDTADGQTMLGWLRSQRQTEQAIERFWQVVLVSALGESLDRASVSAARKVFVDGFLAHREASHVLVPRVSLGELYDRRVADWLRERGVQIRLETLVAGLEERRGRVVGVRTAAGSEPFDAVVLAVPWQRVGALLPETLRNVVDPGDQFAQVPSAPITSVHLWFDRPLTDLPHAVLVGRLSQWVFARRLSDRSGEHYYQVVISASHELSSEDRAKVVDQVRADLEAIFPAAKAATLLRWRIITEHDAVFSVRPGLDALRPPQRTAVPNLVLAGDWTSTGWPATMEGAVRSGYLAAEAVLSQLGQHEQLLVPGLPQGWIVTKGLGLGARARVLASTSSPPP